MLDDLAGKRTGERIQILRERRGLTRAVLAGLVGMSASWLKGIERGTRLPPRLPLLVKLAEALGQQDIAVLAGTDMNIGDGTSIPLSSFARIPHAAIPAIRDAVREPLLSVSAAAPDVAALAARAADAWRLWHTALRHRTGRRPDPARPDRRRPDSGASGHRGAAPRRAGGARRGLCASPA
jgi:transcriptional regulator with XRE-family HTH domain